MSGIGSAGAKSNLWWLSKQLLMDPVGNGRPPSCVDVSRNHNVSTASFHPGIAERCFC